MSQDPSVDLAAVTADDLALDALSSGSAAQLDDAMLFDDPAFDLLADLLADVSTDLPALVPVAVPSSAPVVPLRPVAGRRLARGATAAVAAAAVLTMTGAAAAAATMAPAGTPLHGVGEAVRSAAGAVADAVTPGSPARSVATPSATAPGSSPLDGAASSTAPRSSAPSASDPTPPGQVVAERARSAAAAAAVRVLLDRAEVLLDRGRPGQALSRLDLVDRRLAEVLPVDGAVALRARASGLRERAEQTGAVRPAPPKPAPSRRPVEPQGPGRAERPERGTAPERSGQGPARAPERSEPVRPGASTSSEQRGERLSTGPGSGPDDVPARAVPQLSSTASVKPRA